MKASKPCRNFKQVMKKTPFLVLLLHLFHSNQWHSQYMNSDRAQNVKRFNCVCIHQQQSNLYELFHFAFRLPTHTNHSQMVESANELCSPIFPFIHSTLRMTLIVTVPPTINSIHLILICTLVLTFIYGDPSKVASYCCKCSHWKYMHWIGVEAFLSHTNHSFTCGVRAVFKSTFIALRW